MSSNADKTATVWTENGKKEVFTATHYKASGGEGRVFQKGGTAYKIMHQGKKVIPKGKMVELLTINDDKVLTPQEYVYDKHKKPVGFTMKYVHGVEYLCKLLNTGFKGKKGISPNDTIELVKAMQMSLANVHAANVLVVDFNQMNFLVDGKTLKIPYFIDTDSYQTPSFRATALMECVRDRKMPRLQFNIYSDWFSFACIAFWTYVGTHPYRGSHPNYTKKDWDSKRMDDGVSIFDPNVKPPTSCLDFSVIPKAHLDWFKSIFVNGDRSTPPLPEGQVLFTPGVTIRDVALFVVKLVQEYDSDIRRAFQENDSRFVITNKKLWKNDIPVFTIPQKYENLSFCKVDGDKDPVLAIFDNGQLTMYDWKNNVSIHQLSADAMMAHAGRVYTSNGNKLLEHTCNKFNKLVHSTRAVANIFGSTAKLFDGVVVEDMMGQCRLTIPRDDHYFKGVFVPELDGLRVIDAKFVRKVCVLITEKSGTFERHILTFSKGRSTYHLRTVEASPGDGADFSMKENGMCISPVNEDELEAWKGDKIKVFTDGPVPGGSMMYRERDTIMFITGKKLMSISKK